MNDLIFIFPGLVSAFGLAILHRSHKRLSRRYELLVKELRANLSESEQAAQDQKWYAMPCGTRLELEATGYWIELVGKKGRPSFKAYDPEGDCIGTSQDLQLLKGALERQASYRDEFKPVKKPSIDLQPGNEAPKP